MNQVLIDNSLLTLACLGALVITWRTKRRRLGPVTSFLLLFAALLVFGNMWGHTVAVALVNYGRYKAGIFVYSFAFYGLLLLGVVGIFVSGFNIHHVRRHIKGLPGQKRPLLWLNAATAALFLPLIPLNPIGALPVLAALLSAVTLWVAKIPAANVAATRKARRAFLPEKAQPGAGHLPESGLPTT